MAIEIANGLNKGITSQQIHNHLMVGKLIPLHNLKILGDILISFEPLSTFINIFEEGSTIKKKKKNTQNKRHITTLQLNQYKTQTTTYIYNVKLPMFLQTKV